MIVGIDGDTLVYRCGFAAEASTENPPVSHALQIVKNTITDILVATEADDFIVFISGTDNFRVERAVTHEYKGNRKDARRPIHYDAIREYLVDTYGAEIINGQEADDALGIFLTEDTKNRICCSIDKDLLMVPGKHYNWVKKTFIEIDEITGMLNFFRQLLTGDDTDNIKGIHQVGPAKADKILSAQLATWWLMKVKGAYHKAGMDMDRVHENADLLWIRRKPNQKCPYIGERDE